MDSNKKSFTLTEVLIVLVIIGALALIIIPNLANLMPDDHAIKYKKAFYTIQEIVNDMVNDPSFCPGYSMVEVPDEGLVYTSTDQDIFLSTCGCTAYDESTPPACKSWDKLQKAIFDRLSTVDNSATDNIQTTNGMHWYIPDEDFSNETNGKGFGTKDNTVSIIVNVDGQTVAKTANKTTGDFEIIIHADGKVTPPDEGQGEKELLTKNKM